MKIVVLVAVMGEMKELDRSTRKTYSVNEKFALNYTLTEGWVPWKLRISVCRCVTIYYKNKQSAICMQDFGFRRVAREVFARLGC